MLRGSKITSLKNKANKAKIDGNLKQAIDYYEQIFELESEDPNIPKEIATLYDKLGNKEKSVEYYWKAMEQYMKSEYFQNATAIAQMLLRLGEDELQIKQDLALLYEKQGLIGDAVSAYEEVSELYRKDGDIDGVLENLKKIVNLTPKKIGIRLKLIEIYENQAMHREAIKQMEEVRSIYEEQGRVDKKEKIDEKIKKVSKFVDAQIESESIVFEQEVAEFAEKKYEDEVDTVKETTGQEKIEEEQEEGESLFQDMEQFLMENSGDSKKITEVEHIEEKVELEKVSSKEFEGIEEPEVEDIEDSITRWDDWINLAELYLSVGSDDDAIEYYTKAAEAQFNKRNYKKAYNIYKNISEISSDSIMPRQKMVQSALKMNDEEKVIDAYTSLFRCLDEKGAKEEANRVLEKIVTISPDSPIIHELIGEDIRVSEVPESKKTGKTIDFDELFEEEVASEEEREIEIEMGKAPTLDKLLSEFKKKAAEEISGRDYEAHFNLGISYREMGLIEEAINEFKKAMLGSRWVLKSLEMIGQSYELIDEYEKAEKVYKHILTSDRYDEEMKVVFAYHLGNLYAKRDLFTKALNEYKRVVRWDPEFGDVKKRIKEMNKKISGSKTVEADKSKLSEDLSEESSELWNSVLSDNKGKEPGEGKKSDGKSDKKDSKDKKEKNKISYI